jgi:hypothetical protein
MSLDAMYGRTTVRPVVDTRGDDHATAILRMERRILRVSTISVCRRRACRRQDAPWSVRTLRRRAVVVIRYRRAVVAAGDYVRLRSLRFAPTHIHRPYSA